MSSSPLLMRLLSASVGLSHRAGKIIRDIIKTGDLGIHDKGFDDLQTEADRSVQRCIIGSLQQHFPKISIVGEEDLSYDSEMQKFLEKDFSQDVLALNCPDNLKNVKENEEMVTDFTDSDVPKISDFYYSRFRLIILTLTETDHLQMVIVWVDPLDGTKEFTQGLLDHVTVLIGISVNGNAVGGVVYQPYYNYQAQPPTTLGRCIWGMVGLGTHGMEKKSPPEGKNIITTTRSHSDPKVAGAITACEPTEVMRVGGAGHKVLLVCEGIAHAYVFASKGCKKWDTCAPEGILRAMGGSLTDLHGNDIVYRLDVPRPNLTGVVATLENHDWYINKIPEDIKALFAAPS